MPIFTLQRQAASQFLHLIKAVTFKVMAYPVVDIGKARFAVSLIASLENIQLIVDISLPALPVTAEAHHTSVVAPCVLLISHK